MLFLFFAGSILLFHSRMFEFTFYEDDWLFFKESQDILSGRSGLLQGIFGFNNYHFIPFTKTLYYLFSACSVPIPFLFNLEF